MNKTSVFVMSVGHDFWKLPDGLQESLVRKLYHHALTGECDVKQSTGTDQLRWLDGDYRLVFEEDSTTLTVRAIAHRRNKYR